jgi:hypothetical protein
MNPEQRNTFMSTQDRPPPWSAGAPVAVQFTEARRCIEQLWQKVLNAQNEINKILQIVDFTVSTNRLLKIISEKNGHSSKMPDDAGSNEDHDKRYVRIAQFASLFTNASNLKMLNLKDSTEITIAGGIVTASQSFHRIDTESNGPTDDLDTINGGSDGDILFLRAENDARTVVLKHGTGNIVTAAGTDYSLDTINKIAMLIFDGSNWILNTP